MPLVNFIRELLPMFYWSAGFIAVLTVVSAVALVLYALTRWGPWLVVSLSAVVYLLPLLATLR